MGKFQKFTTKRTTKKDKDNTEQMIWEISECTVCSTTSILANRGMSRVIWNLLLLHTSKVFCRLDTYDSNLTFLKARGNSHDYNTDQGSSKTGRFIRHHF